MISLILFSWNYSKLLGEQRTFKWNLALGTNKMILRSYPPWIVLKIPEVEVTHHSNIGKAEFLWKCTVLACFYYTLVDLDFKIFLFLSGEFLICESEVFSLHTKKILCFYLGPINCSVLLFLHFDFKFSIHFIGFK